MTVSEVEQQRVVGAAEGKPPCVHHEIDTEVSPDGEFTGFEVCSSCGEHVGKKLKIFSMTGKAVRLTKNPKAVQSQILENSSSAKKGALSWKKKAVFSLSRE